MKLGLAAITLLVVHGFAEFTPHFNHFLKKKYGEHVHKHLERLDLGYGPAGSFGGKKSRSDPINKRPILFVHGATTCAIVFVGHREFFNSKGYSNSELYATSYGDAGWTSLFDISIECSYVWQIRHMIIALHEYTKKKIDIIAWSMGSLITRKAILGGKCAENNRHVGKPLTDMVDTFVAIGGVNYGLAHCPTESKACNSINSMHCNSALLKELNSQPERYEGSNSYAIYSLTDIIIGQHCCGQICAELKNANASYEKPNRNHLSIITGTLQFQYDLINH